VKRFKNIPVRQFLVGATLLALLCGLILLLPKPVGRMQPNGGEPPLPAMPAFQAKVIGVTDGDSLVVITNGQTIKIRLAQIDAPERRQPYGQQSRLELTRLVNGKMVIIVPQTTDRYGRTVANLTVDQRDVNQAMVARGAAWAYKDYVRDQAFFALEARARTSRQGLWALSGDQRVAPWEYRRQQRGNVGVVTGR
jgi:micrococcal nuclease